MVREGPKGVKSEARIARDNAKKGSGKGEVRNVGAGRDVGIGFGGVHGEKVGGSWG